MKNDGRHRDSITDERPAHVVIDGNYVSARWPGDAHTFAKRYVSLLDQTAGRGSMAPPVQAARDIATERRIDEQEEESFPASDPHSDWAGTGHLRIAICRGDAHRSFTIRRRPRHRRLHLDSR
jgi:hypothetical protein